MKSKRYLTQYDASILCMLAESLLRLGDIDFNAGEKLLQILSGSVILPEHVRKKDCVSLFSEVTYSSLAPAITESIILVCPPDASCGLARMSVISPIGLALVGHEVNTIVDVAPPTGPYHHIRITDVKSLMTADALPAASPGRLFH